MIECDEEVEVEDDKGKKKLERHLVSDEVNIPKMMAYVQRDGKQFTYAIEEEEEVGTNLEDEKEKILAQKKAEKERIKAEKAALKKAEKEKADKLAKLIESEKLKLDKKSQPLRQYLADNIIPLLTQGLIEISNEMPKSPIAFLADYLEEH